MQGTDGVDKEKFRTIDAAANEVWTYLLEKKGTTLSTLVVDGKKEEKDKGGEIGAEPLEESQKIDPAKKGRKSKKSPKRRAEEVLVNIRKKQNKVVVADAEPVTTGCEKSFKHRDGLRATWKKGDSSGIMSNKPLKKQDATMKPIKDNDSRNSDIEVNSKYERKNEKNESDGTVLKNDVELVNGVESLKWTKLEKGLYEKGLEMFGKNRFGFFYLPFFVFFFNLSTKSSLILNPCCKTVLIFRL